MEFKHLRINIPNYRYKYIEVRCASGIPRHSASLADSPAIGGHIGGVLCVSSGKAVMAFVIAAKKEKSGIGRIHGLLQPGPAGVTNRARRQAGVPGWVVGPPHMHV